MIIRLKLLGDVRRHAKDHDATITRELPPNSRVADLIGTIGIPADEEMIVGINGQLASIESALADGDEVMLITPMAGGANRRPV